MPAKKKNTSKKEKPTLFEKTIKSFTMVGPVDNPNIKKIDSEEGLPFKLLVALQKAKQESTKIVYAKTNSIFHSIYSVYATTRSKEPALYIVMGSVVGINYTYVNLIGVSPDARKVGKIQMVGD